MDYDKQYEEDIEKATALSLETLALEQFRRNKSQYSSISDVATTTSILKSTCKWNGIYYLYYLNLYHISSFQFHAQLNSTQFNVVVLFRCNTHAHAAYNTLATQRPRPGSNGNTTTTFATNSLPNSMSNGSLAPPPCVPPRNTRTGNNRDEPDLISFTAESASSTQSIAPDTPITNAHANLMQIVSEIHRKNTNLSSNSFGYASQAQAAGMQLVPYAGNLNAASFTQQSTVVPLTGDQLTKLYSMGTYGRSSSMTTNSMTSFNQYTFPTASTSITAFAPETFPLHSTQPMYTPQPQPQPPLPLQAPPTQPIAAPQPFNEINTNTLYSPMPATNVSRSSLSGPYTASHSSFGANVMSPTESMAPKLPPRQFSQGSMKTNTEANQTKLVRKESSNVVHRRTSNVAKNLGDDLIDLDHGIVDK